MFKTRKYLLLYLLFVTIGLGKLYAQKHTYSIHVAGKEIGEVTASLTESGHTQTYEIISDATLKIFWKRYNRKTSSFVIYQNEAVKTSFAGVYMNNNLEDSAAINLDQNSYDCYRYPDERFVLNDTEVHFTTAKLYFQEPVGIQKIYSERFLKFCPLEVRGDHKYKLSLPNGRANYYTYANSTLIEVFIDRTLFNIKFRQK